MSAVIHFPMKAARYEPSLADVHDNKGIIEDPEHST